MKDLTLATRVNYVNGGVIYLKEGRKTCGITSSLCKALDRVVSECVQPLTPSKQDRRRVYDKKFTRKDNTPPVAKLDIIKKPLTAKLSYGVKIGDIIKCFPSYDETSGFLKGLLYAGQKNGKMVSFESVEEVKG